MLQNCIVTNLSKTSEEIHNYRISDDKMRSYNQCPSYFSLISSMWYFQILTIDIFK